MLSAGHAAKDLVAACTQVENLGLSVWTAGQWSDAAKKSDFVWKTKASTFPMNYTNWYKGEPNNMRGEEGCVNLWLQQNYTWNDAPCHTPLCFVCEVSPSA